MTMSSENADEKRSQATETRSYRGISVRAATGYLENLGGEQISDGVVEGPDWCAALSEEKVSIGPSMKLTEVTVEFVGESEEVLEPVIEKFSQKAIRAGG
jgi:hypothetical protein